MEKSTKKAYILPVVWAIIAGVITVVGFAIQAANYRYMRRGIEQAYTFKPTYSVGKTTAIMGQQRGWTKGNIRYGVNQTKGTPKTTKYSIFYRKNNNISWYLAYSNGYTNANNVYYGPYYMHASSGKDKYGYRLEKNSNKNIYSAINVDIFAE